MAPSPARLQFGPVTLVPDERVLLKDGQPVALTPKAFDLLVFLASSPGRLLTKDEILAGDRALVAKHVPHNVVDQDLWLFNLARNENPTRLTFAESLESWPAWLTNDRFAYGAGGGERTIYEQTIGNDKSRREWSQGFGASGVTAADSGRIAVFPRLGQP